MNAERLLEHYEKIADASDAIARLRRFILDLAVRGKLVPQDPANEPASELLKLIDAGRRLAGCKAGAEVAAKSPPFDLPSGWVWSTIGSICSKTGSGSTPRGGKEVYIDHGIPFLRSQNVYDDGLRLSDVAYIAPEVHLRMAGTAVKASDLLLNITGGSMGRCCRVPDQFGEGNISQHVAIIRPAIVSMAHYIHKLVLSPYFQAFIFDEQTGAGRGGLPKNRMDQITVALPPLAEQHRIVAKVDELMALCDQLEAARIEREAKRDRLAAASLARLNNLDPETFRDDARFALDTLPALTARPDQIKQLRQTILNLAVSGKLVPQDPADEPAEELDVALPRSRSRPFEIPCFWTWSRLKAVGKLMGGGTPSKSNREFWGGDIPWVSPKDMKVDYLSEAQMTITEKAISNSSVNVIDQGSLLFVVRGMILAHSFPVAINQSAVTINQDMKALIPKNGQMAEYLLRALKGLKPQMLAKVQRSSHGTCRLEGSDYSEFLIPIPPLAEQHRIVAKVDELMTLCDQLESSLTSADDTRRKLLDALLAEALAPVNVEYLQEAAQ
ncbi:type I restriction endonuclease subunit S [Rhizobium laguerreae]|uniref:restriction endonuclease subunit S n=1 Tax=Rhizobium laguerreae TaxID=1076926 RepID=UPI00143F565B|nr:restriction endonuclease subunit S [Rhizobium laguerreae]NKM12094.1 type I restriction endonuclease subunit S [Rhizobium laguerreae]